MRLSHRQLNRATLARQFLLERSVLDPVAAIGHLGALQAQEPASPYLALWARLEGFEPELLHAAILDRRVVKATLHRSTLHLVTATDYLASVAALTAVLRTRWMRERRGLPVIRSLPELADASLDFANRPRANVEMRDHVGSLGEPVPADELWRRIRRYAPFVQAPAAETWSYGRRPMHVAARVWLTGRPTAEAASLAHVLRCYLRAFGPASLADAAQWTGITVSRLRAASEDLDDLIELEGPDGRALLDLRGAPIPEEDVPAPPRLLPMWDEMLLAYRDRARVLPERFRKRVIVKAGDVLPSFTIDGYVAGLWWAEELSGGEPRIELEPFEPIPAAARTDLEEEMASLSVLIRDREPGVYVRYRHTRRRA